MGDEVKSLITAAAAALATIVLPAPASAQDLFVVCQPDSCRLMLQQERLSDSETFLLLVTRLVGERHMGNVRLVLERDADASPLPATVAEAVAGLERVESLPFRQPTTYENIQMACVVKSLSCSIMIRGKLIHDYSDVVFGDLVTRVNAAGMVVTKLSIQSPGGHMRAGFAIGRRIHRAAITVSTSYWDKINGEPYYCASACTFIFLASRTGRYSSLPSWYPAIYGDDDDAARRTILFHNWRYDELDRITDSQYLSGIENATEDAKRFLRDIGMPEVIADWAQSIPSREIRPLSPSQWRLVGELPPALNDLIYARCGALFDDWQEASAAYTTARQRGAARAEFDRLEKLDGDLRDSSVACVDNIVLPIQREAQLGRG